MLEIAHPPAMCLGVVLKFAQGPCIYAGPSQEAMQKAALQGLWGFGLPLAILICLLGLVVLFVRLKALLESSFF